MTPLDQALAIRAPSDLSDRTTLSFDCHAKLRWTASARFAPDYQWFHEAASGSLDADFGDREEMAACSEVTFQWTGSVRIAVLIDERGRLRLSHKLAGRELPGVLWVRAQPAVLLGDGRPRALLDRILGIPDAAELVDEQLSSLKAFYQLTPERRKAVTGLAGAIRSERELADTRKDMADAETLCRRVYERAREALERKLGEDLGARLGRASAGQPLLDFSFAFTDEGLRLYRRALSGDLQEISGRDCEHATLMADKVGLRTKEVRLELQMPYLKRRSWAGRLALFSGMSVEAGPAGVIAVSAAKTAGDQGGSTVRQGAMMLAGSLPFRGRPHGDRFSLSFSHRQRHAAAEAPIVLEPLLAAYAFGPEAAQSIAGLSGRAGDIETEISLRLPSQAVSVWLDVPSERSIGFYKAFVGVSTAIQRANRLWFPYAYFDRAERYDDLEMALPLVVYRASKPYSRQARSEFTYDAMNPKSVRLAFHHAGRTLPSVLRSVYSRLLAAGRPDVAARYAPEKARQLIASVARGRKRFTSLLAADASLVGEMVKFGNRGRLLGAALDGPPSNAAGNVSRFLDRFTRSIDTRLRRGYGGRDFLNLVPVLAVEATQALSTAFGGDTNIECVLRVRVPGEEGERIYVNDHRRCPGNSDR